MNKHKRNRIWPLLDHDIIVNRTTPLDRDDANLNISLKHQHTKDNEFIMYVHQYHLKRPK